MQPTRPLRLFIVCCAGGIAACALSQLAGQDDAPSKPEKDKPAAANADNPEAEKPSTADLQAEWKKLSARKIEIARTLRELRAEFNKPGVKEPRQREISREFNALVGEYQLEIERRMGELAEAIYAADPEDVEAAEAVMETAYKENRYQRALDIAKQLLESGAKPKYDSHLAINIAGAASFALNEFAQAEKYLNEASEKRQLLDQYGGRFHEQLPAYLKLWQAEQEIREREANVPADEKLPLVELTVGSDGKERGTVVIELFENEAPNTVANFISIVEHPEKNYNGVKFHRVIPNFMAQTGNLEASGKGDLGYTIKCECYQENARKHFRGSVSMALKGKDTGDSQFFITHIPTYWLNEEVNPESVHTVFGRVVQGMDVIDEIEQGDQILAAQVLSKRDHEYKPVTSASPTP